MPLDRPILIVGGGVVGPAVAIALKRFGFDAEVFETREGISAEIGAFMNVAPNGMNVLRQLGIHDAVAAHGSFSTGFGFINSSGRQFAFFDSAHEEEQFGAHNCSMRRAALHKVTSEYAISLGVKFHYGKRLVGVQDETPTGAITATFADGTVVVGSLLLACDGIRSAVRSIIFPDYPAPDYVKLLNTGGYSLVPKGMLAKGPFHGFFGKRGFFGATVTAPNLVGERLQGMAEELVAAAKGTGKSGQAAAPKAGANISATNRPVNPSMVGSDGCEMEIVGWWANLPRAVLPDRAAIAAVPTSEWVDEIADLFTDDDPRLVQIVRATFELFTPFGDFAMPCLPQWSKGRVCLVGDAAHAAPPHGGNGASLALEDSVTIARCLKEAATHTEAFAQFQKERQARCERIIAGAKRNASTKYPGKVGAWFRDMILPIIFKFAKVQIDKDYAFRTRFDEPILAVTQDSEGVSCGVVRGVDVSGASASVLGTED